MLAPRINKVPASAAKLPSSSASEVQQRGVARLPSGGNEVGLHASTLPWSMFTALYET